MSINTTLVHTYHHFNICLDLQNTGSMDTPIRLVRNRLQVAFLGNISNMHLQCLNIRSSQVLISAIKWVFREDFIGVEDRYPMNKDICLCFMDYLLDIGMDGLLITHLTQALFPKTYLGRLAKVIHFIVPFVGLPMASDLRCFIDHNEVVQWNQFVSSFKTMILSQHRYCVERVANFLLHLHCLIPSKGVTWYPNFWDYIFPIILTPEEPS